MGDPQNKSKRSQRRKRNFIAKTLWEDRRFRNKIDKKAIEVRTYEDERDAQREIKDYLSETFGS